MSDLIFDVKEFGLHDGNGMRTTVFFKGCPLKCVWCHNPESQSFEKELIRNLNKCTHCGLCRRKCEHKECEGLGVCTRICPNDNVKAAGKEYSPEELAKKLLKNEIFLKNGGVTFSGGEPLCHTEFIAETVKYLNGIKTAVETCGYVKSEQFKKAAELIDDVYMDIKLFDETEHIKYTGKSNKIILENAEYLLNSDKKVTFRIPLIPTITDTDENLSRIAEFLKKGKTHIKVELIPYNKLTGAKYRSVGREYSPCFDENKPLNKNTKIFDEKNIKCIAF